MEWISVKDEEAPDGYVLIWGTNDHHCALKNGPHCMFVNVEHGIYRYGEYDCIVEATHWMKLPEEPKKEW